MAFLLSLFIVIYGAYVLFILSIKLLFRWNRNSTCTEKINATVVELRKIGEDDYPDYSKKDVGLFDKIINERIGQLYSYLNDKKKVRDILLNGVNPVNDIKEDVEHIVTNKFKLKNLDRWRKYTRRGICTFEHAGRSYTTEIMSFSGISKNVQIGSEIEIYYNLNNPEKAIIKNSKTKTLFGIQIASMVLTIGLMLCSWYTITDIWSIGNHKSSGNNSGSTSGSTSTVLEPDREEEEDITLECTEEPTEYTYVDVNYMGIIKVVPENFSKPVYKNNDEKSGQCVFYDKNTKKKVCAVVVREYKNIDVEVERITNSIKSKGRGYKRICNYVIRGQDLVVDRIICTDKNDEEYYCHYAYWFDDNKVIIVVHYSSYSQLVNIAIRSL